MFRMRPRRNRRHDEFASCEFACTSSTWRSSRSASSEVGSIGAPDRERQVPCFEYGDLHSRGETSPRQKRRRIEVSKIRRKSVTLRAARPRVARSNEAMIPKHKHPRSQAVLVFGDHCLVRTPARRAGALQPQFSDKHGVRAGESGGRRLHPPGAGCGDSIRSPSILRFFDSST